MAQIKKENLRMQYTLLTFQSVLFCKTSLLSKRNAVDFMADLNLAVDKFSKDSGIDKSKIAFEQVTNSDWCAGCTVLYSNVPINWKVPENIDISICDVQPHKGYKDKIVSLSNKIEGRRKLDDIGDYGSNFAQRFSHELFHSKSQ